MGAWQEPPPITPMGLFYPNVTPVIWIGTKSGTTLTAHALTNAYSGSTATKYVSGFSVMTIDVAYTVGAAETNNTCDIQLEHSVDGTNFYILTNEAASAGTSTLTNRKFEFTGASAGTYTFSYRLDISYKYIRLSALEGGVSSNAGTIFVEGVLAGN